MKIVDIELDLSSVHSLLDLHKILMKVFGFPDFYGMNGNALIDCLTDIRVKGDKTTTMCDVYIESNEILAISVKNLSRKDEFIISELIIATEEVNRRSLNFLKVPSIYLSLR